MKLKEYPVSIWHSLRLWLTPADSLGQGASPAPEPVIVSLTSIPSRLPMLHLTIRSLLDQNVAPEKIVLWLNHALEPDVPRRLASLCGERFEIRYADQTCAHRKLVHSLREYPQHTIVTCDDDLIYRRDWLARLLEAHRQYPDDVVAHECRRICFDEQGELLSYRQWAGEEPGGSHRYTLAIGYGGTLYPPGCLHAQVMDAELYGSLAPRADDLWFKAMSLAQGTATRRSPAPPKKPIPVMRTQAVRLGNDNIKRDANRSQWQALMQHFGFVAE